LDSNHAHQFTCTLRENLLDFRHIANILFSLSQKSKKPPNVSLPRKNIGVNESGPCTRREKINGIALRGCSLAKTARTCSSRLLARLRDMVKRSLDLFMLVTLLALLVTCSPAAREEPQSVSLVVINGIVVDGTGANPIPDGLVAIEGNRIVAVGHSNDIKLPKDVIVIDAKGGTILPGVINSHAHKDFGAGTRRIMFLLDGVTSVCDMMTSLQVMSYLEEGEGVLGPAARGFKAGPMITAPGGYPRIWGPAYSYEIQGEHEAEIAVRDLHARGADYIKVALEPGIFGEPWPVLNLQELRAVVATAHAHDLLVRAHVNNAMLDIALEAGIDVIEHVPMPSFSHEDLDPMFDDAGVFRMPAELEAQMLRMIDQGIVLVPTLDVLIDDAYQHGDIELETEVVNQAVLSVVRFFHDTGGIIAVGNDYGNAGVQPGMPLREMDLLQTVGLSPMEVIEAGTKYAAYVCGHRDELGTLETGKLADLIVVAGNPLDDLSAMDSVLYVVKDGEVVVSPQQESK
jgi:imidazolonepropionase-like amidohydrolase